MDECEICDRQGDDAERCTFGHGCSCWRGIPCGTPQRTHASTCRCDECRPDLAAFRPFAAAMREAYASRSDRERADLESAWNRANLPYGW